MLNAIKHLTKIGIVVAIYTSSFHTTGILCYLGWNSTRAEQDDDNSSAGKMKEKCKYSHIQVLSFDNPCSKESIAYYREFKQVFRTSLMPRIGDCFREADDRGLGLDRIMIEFRIDRTGHTEDATARQLINEYSIKIKESSLRCIANAVSHAIFPSPPGGAKLSVKYPLTVKIGSRVESNDPRKQTNVTGMPSSSQGPQGKKIPTSKDKDTTAKGTTTTDSCDSPKSPSGVDRESGSDSKESEDTPTTAEGPAKGGTDSRDE